MKTAGEKTQKHELVQPRALAHRGVVEASGLLFDTDALGEIEARCRVLRFWTVGANVLRWENYLLLRLPAPIRLSQTSAPGTLLTLQNSLLAAVPLSQSERLALDAQGGTIVVVRGGAARAFSPSDARAEDPADWLDVSGWTIAPVKTLGQLPAAPRDVIAPADFDARARLGHLPDNPERAKVVEALRSAAQRGMELNAALARSGLSGAASQSSRGPSWLQKLAQSLAKATENPAQTGAAPYPDTLRMAAHRLAARMLMLTGLSDIVGRRQAEYIRGMMEMFERGDLNQALLHAIGMGDMEGFSPPPALRVPSPRDTLALSPYATPAKSSLNLPPEVTQHLRKLYRDAFERLEREGRIEEAAFVLAELLGANEEAVNFLEKHGRLQLAAEMAGARDLPAGLIVRQWFLADNVARAVQIARRTGAWADAIVRLERAHPDEARRLRVLWAQSLAVSGDFARAVDIVLPLRDELWQEAERREEITAWIAQGVELGGAVGARMLAQQLALVPERETQTRERSVELLEDEAEENAPARIAFAQELWVAPTTPLTQTLARLTVRAALRDMGNTRRAVIDENAYKRLLRLADDGALRADAPPFPKTLSASATLLPVLELALAAEDRGTLACYDAAVLPDGRCLAALGEAGLRLLTRDGRTITHWDTPAHRLVMSDVGNRALALAPRGEIWRIAQMDIGSQRIEKWGEARLDIFAPDYDGSLWFVSVQNELLALDAVASDVAALWRLSRLEGRILTLSRSVSQCSLLLFSAGATDTWGRPAPLWTRLERLTHSLPDLMLRERKEVQQIEGFRTPAGNTTATSPLAAGSPSLEKLTEGVDYAQAIAPSGEVHRLIVESLAERAANSLNAAPIMEAKQSAPDSQLTLPLNAWRITLLRPNAPNVVPVPVFSEEGTADTPRPLPPVLSPTHILLVTLANNGAVCHLLTRANYAFVARITLGGAAQVNARFTTARLVLSDDCGRLLVFALDPLHLIRDLRLR